MNSEKDIVVHLVHGTFDPRKPGVPHWSDPDGILADGIKARLPEDLRNRVSFEPFDWSGKNSFKERQQATDALTDMMKRSDRRLRFFIGHSHGGTVIADALVATEESDAVGVMTLATPFVARVLDVSQGRLGMALYAPVLAFWVSFSGALACAIHQAWTGAGLCIAAALIALLGFASSRVGRWAGIFGSVAILTIPLAFLVAAFWDSNPLSTLPATLLAVLFLVIFTAPHWTEWTFARLSALRGIPAETELPKAPDVPLTAFRLPGDEASFAIVVAQAMVWFETKNVLGTVTQMLRRFCQVDDDKTVRLGLRFVGGLLVLEPGITSLTYDALTFVPSVAEDTFRIDRPIPLQQLPAELFRYTLPSRYCDSDRLRDFAWQQFGRYSPGLERVQAICDWLHTNIEYRTGSGSSEITASEVIERGYGVCRDFAHCGVALCRTFNIPARYVSGYVPDIACFDPGTPMDFHAYFEVYLGDRWQVFDARFNRPRVGRVRIAAGLDAATCAFSTCYGAARLTWFEVWSYQVDPTICRVGDPVDLSRRLCGTPEIKKPKSAAASTPRSTVVAQAVDVRAAARERKFTGALAATVAD